MEKGELLYSLLEDTVLTATISKTTKETFKPSINKMFIKDKFCDKNNSYVIRIKATLVNGVVLIEECCFDANTSMDDALFMACKNIMKNLCFAGFEKLSELNKYLKI